MVKARESRPLVPLPNVKHQHVRNMKVHGSSNTAAWWNGPFNPVPNTNIIVCLNTSRISYLLGIVSTRYCPSEERAFVSFGLRDCCFRLHSLVWFFHFCLDSHFRQKVAEYSVKGWVVIVDMFCVFPLHICKQVRDPGRGFIIENRFIWVLSHIVLWKWVVWNQLLHAFIIFCSIIA